jgi:hypothetical protein
VPLFFIEMGQGIIARGDLRVRTSPLYSCTLIAGRNAGSGYGGAYHYPADALSNDDEVQADMDVWAAILRPTSVTLVFAADATGTGAMGTALHDRHALQQWVLQTCGVVPTTVSANAAGMELFPGGYSADRLGNLAGDFSPAHAIHVDHRMPGRYLDHGGFTLVGEDRN